MNCEEINKQLGDVLDGAVDPEMETVVMRHISTCSSCQNEWERIRAVRSILRATEAPMPPASLDARVMGAFYKTRIGRSEAPGNWWQRLVFGSIRIPKPAFALIVVAFASALALALQMGRTKQTPLVVTVPTPMTVEVPAPAPPPQIVYVPIESVRSAQDAAPRAPKRQLVARATKARRPLMQTPESPLENTTVVTVSGTNYSTKATLKDFEPITNATVRVMKGRGEL